MATNYMRATNNRIVLCMNENYACWNVFTEIIYLIQLVIWTYYSMYYLKKRENPNGVDGF